MVEWETNRNIDAVRCENAKNTWDIVNAIRTDGQETRSLINANEMARLRDELDQMMILWDWEHEQMIDGITEIKQLQDYYKSL